MDENKPPSGMVIVWTVAAMGLGGILAAVLFVMGFMVSRWLG